MIVQTIQSASRPAFYYQRAHKRVKLSGNRKDSDGTTFSTSVHNDIEEKKPKTSLEVIDYRDPFAIPNMLERLDCGKYGSVTKEMEDLIAQNMQMLNPYFAKYPMLFNTFSEVENNQSKEVSKEATRLLDNNVIDLEDDRVADNALAVSQPVVVIDSDEEDNGNRSHFVPFQEVVLPRPAGQFLMKDFLVSLHCICNHVVTCLRMQT